MIEREETTTMYSKTYNLYPYSKRNVPALQKYANYLIDQSEIAESNKEHELADRLFNMACSIMAICKGGLHGWEDTNCLWLTGADINMAKKAVALAP